MDYVQAKDVVKRYGSQLSVDHLSFGIREGEVYGLLGPNGAGKSTTIKMMCGLLKPDSGDITIGGLSVRSHPLEVKKRIGVVPQDLAIYEDLTARENVTFFAKLYGLRGKELESRVDEALGFVGLLDRQKDKPGAYSGGMKRRLNIACAITHRPSLIIMDEPTVGIDPQSRNHILESVRTLNRSGSTIIYTTHYMEEVEAIGTRIGIMDHGRLIASGTKEELVRQLAREEKLVIRTDGAKLSAIEELREHRMVQRVDVEGDELTVYLPSSSSYLQDILFILSKHEVSIQTLTRVEPDLETVFLSLTGRTLRD
ncbi:ABC transporter ATP-binding protein [Paenibacillus flagellatus]|uniref:Export ABC transporter ATP-binding protein n=1 Tax=Paenibacillus flagellatus TaxID=2211139 RepID=A0A2V5K5C0_9BACL|nr:ABC transporter ATP-binding protein [Paenibacillus flagellatus]PYI54448.1 export ABC transporter ATP-binding protein [Paenibacillus flagellatus]